MLSIKNLRHAYHGMTVLEVPRLEVLPESPQLLLGPSGSGKSTLLHIAGALLQPTAGQISVDGNELSGVNLRNIERFRGRNIGIVFQRLHLIPSLSLLQNLLAAQYCANLPTDSERVLTVLESLGLGAKAQAFPSALSQGQAQRAAIARAVVNRPRLLLADEPTSALDDVNATIVLELLIEQARACNAALLIATHDARAKDRIPLSITLSATSMAVAA